MPVIEPCRLLEVYNPIPVGSFPSCTSFSSPLAAQVMFSLFYGWAANSVPVVMT